MADIRHTFFGRPQTRLAVSTLGALAARRVQDTVVLDRTVLATPEPTVIVSRGPVRDHPPPPRTEGSAGSHATILFSPRSAGVDDKATVILPPRRDDSGEGPRTFIRKSLPAGWIVHRYRIEKVIGEGGFGITYAAEDTVVRRRVALKELFLDGACYRTQTNEVRSANPARDDRLLRWISYYFSEEARITFSLRHEGIVRIYDFFRTNNTAYIVYEMIDGADMRRWGESARDSLGHGDILELLRAASDALGHVHESGFLHRDLKPGNILITGARRLPILIDFGAAVAQGTEPDGEIITTPGFSPPEQYRTDARPDVRSDLYALCATFYWLLSGRSPPDAQQRLSSDDMQPLSQLIDRPSRFGERLYRVISQGLSLEPSQRYDSVARLLDDLFPKTTLGATGYAPRPRGDKIFLSYRRSEGAHFTGRLLDFLEMRFGAETVFVDAHSIPPGTDFWDHIKGVLCACAIQLVIIGPEWARLLHARRRRWYQTTRPDDYIVQEIAAAVELQLPILPILFDGATMPRRGELPPELQLLPNLNASLVGSADVFRVAAESLCDHIAHLRLAGGRPP